MRPRVFVSSVIEGFERYRDAVKNGITCAGGEPVLVEDYGSLSISPRSACLDGVASCDILIVIVGSRGGWTTPAGKLVVEEEYEEALRRKLRVLAFIEDIQRDEEAQRFVDKVSNYIDGLFRMTFRGSSELQGAVLRVLEPVIIHHKKERVETAMIQDRLASPYLVQNETSLRFVLAPERVDELVDPVLLDSREFRDEVFRIAHSLEVGLFSYERPKESEVGVDEIVILQSDDRGRHEGIDEVRLELTTGGTIMIDSNVTGHVVRGAREDLMSNMVVIEDDILARLKKCFAFARAFFEARDPFKRYDRMLYGAALSGLGMRTLETEVPKGSHCIGHHDDQVVIAFPRPRILVRADLTDASQQVENTLALFRRRLKHT